MSAVEAYEVEALDLSTQRTTEGFLFTAFPGEPTMTRRSREWSPEEKLALLRDLLKRKYGL